MKLLLENIGKVRSAHVEINGITVIAGENDTGKSTVGKALFSVFNSLYHIDQQIQEERIKSIQGIFDLLYGNVANLSKKWRDTRKISQYIFDKSSYFASNAEALKKFVLDDISQFDNLFGFHHSNDSVDWTVKRLMDILCVPDPDIFKAVLKRKLEEEFNSQITNIYLLNETGKIQLTIQGQSITIKITEDGRIDIDKQINLQTESVYIDDPFVLDESEMLSASFWRRNNFSGHRNHLKKKLCVEKSSTTVIDEIIVSNKFEEIFRKLASICDGDIILQKQSGFGYRKLNSEKILDMKNLSAGLKTFVILKTLLQNGVIEYDGTIILDEPEIHLHPEWQLMFAELIVLIHQKFNVHILLNTHSPYFLNALEVYSAKYGVAGKCKYYLAQNDGNVSDIKDVTDNIEAIYSKLASPLQKLENERYFDDES